MINIFKSSKPSHTNWPTIEPGIVERIKEMERNAPFGFFAGCDNAIDARFWMKEFGGCNVTLLLDDFFEKTSKSGIIYCLTGEARSAAHYISVLTLDGLSSGVRVADRFDYEGEGILALEVHPLLVKHLLLVPEDPFAGFTWKPYKADYIIKSRAMETLELNNRFILNFAVSGEFNLSLWYVPEGNSNPIYMFSKGFYCK